MTSIAPTQLYTYVFTGKAPDPADMTQEIEFETYVTCNNRNIGQVTNDVMTELELCPTQMNIVRRPATNGERSEWYAARDLQRATQGDNNVH